MRPLPRSPDPGDITDAAAGGRGEHSWGFGSFLFVDREYEGVLPPDQDPSDVQPPWRERIAS